MALVALRESSPVCCADAAAFPLARCAARRRRAGPRGVRRGGMCGVVGAARGVTGRSGAAHVDEGRVARATDTDATWAALAGASMSRYADLEAAAGARFFARCGHLAVASASRAEEVRGGHWGSGKSCDLERVPCCNFTAARRQAVRPLRLATRACYSVYEAVGT